MRCSRVAGARRPRPSASPRDQRFVRPAVVSQPSSGAAAGTAGADKGANPTTGADGTASPSVSPTPSSGSASVGPEKDGSAPGQELPEAPEATVDSLADLLDVISTAPLVRSPLPGRASARGRLVTHFPPVLRPTRAARVESSSLSPSGDRLQVGLVATTSLNPALVLMSYRTRLAKRGLDEHGVPATVAGSQAAAFRRGDSVVTVTVTPDGSQRRYSVHASLRAAGG